MANKVNRTTLSASFADGDRPSGSQFADLIESSMDICASTATTLQSTASFQGGTGVSITQSGSVIIISAQGAFNLSASLGTTLTLNASLQAACGIYLTQTGSIIQIGIASPLSLVNGTVASPTVLWTDIGFYRPSASTLAISINACECIVFAPLAAKFIRNGATTFDNYQFSAVRRSGTGGSISNGDVVLDYLYNAHLAAGETSIGLIRVSVPNATASYMSEIGFFTSASGALGQYLTLQGANVVVGTAAVVTTATDGFLYITSASAPPTGTPTSFAGRTPMVYDTGSNRLYIYNGSWKLAAFV